MSKSAVVRGASQAASICNKIDTAVEAKGSSKDTLDILDKKEGASLVDVIADILVKAKLKIRTRFNVGVDYSKSIADMVKAGEYDYANPDITAENFPVEGEGVVETEVILVPFNRSIKSAAAIKELEQMGLEPCKVEHLLALGAKHPGLQREFPIVCLGSSWVDSAGNRRVPYLGGWSAGRRLHLPWFVSRWSGRCRFAAVRK